MNKLTPRDHQDLIKSQIFSSYNNVSVKKEEVSGLERFSKSETEILADMIEKGEISDTLGSGYGAGSVPVEFNKTGAEIKEKLPIITASLEGQKTVLEAQLTALQEQIGETPTNPNPRRYSKVVSFLRYDYGKSEPKYLGNNMYSETTDTMTLCGKYNSLIWVYNDIMDDIDAVKILKNNLEDKKQYKLSVSQLIALSFN